MILNRRKFCKCNCGSVIKTKAYHKYYGTPDYISGHNPTGNKNWSKGLTKETDERVRRNAASIFLMDVDSSI